MNDKVKEHLILVLYEQAEIEITNNDFLKALSTLGQLLELLKDQETHQAYGGVHKLYASIYRYQGKYQAALNSAGTALKYFEQVKDQGEVMRVHALLGDIYLHFFKYEEAVDKWEYVLTNSANCLQGREKELFKGQICLKLGETYILLSQPKKARSSYVKGLACGRASKNDYLIRYCFEGIGVTYHLENRLQLALPLYYRTLKLVRKTADQKLLGRVLHSMGDVFTKRGLLHRALMVYSKSLEISEKNQDFLTSAATLRELGRIYLKVEPSKTLYYSDLALDKLIANITAETRGECERLMAKVFYLNALYYYKVKETKLAMENLVEAGEIFHKFEMIKDKKRAEVLYQEISGKPVQGKKFTVPQSLMTKLGIV